MPTQYSKVLHSARARLKSIDKCTKNGTFVGVVSALQVRFYRSVSGAEPVRDWLTEMGRPNKAIIGKDIKTVQIGWPLGMPLVRKMDPGLWEIRSEVPEGIARVLFTIDGGVMILLHGFTKKSQKTPESDLKLAKARRREVLDGKA